MVIGFAMVMSSCLVASRCVAAGDFPEEGRQLLVGSEPFALFREVVLTHRSPNSVFCQPTLRHFKTVSQAMPHVGGFEAAEVVWRSPTNSVCCGHIHAERKTVPTPQ
ncbi:MAG: hypothetical protein R2851_23270 [Caldilineaceae bacterium]